MARKLIIVWLSLTMITFSSISIYATEQTQGEFFIPKTSLEGTSFGSNDASVLDAGWEKKESRTQAVIYTAEKIADISAEKEKKEKEKLEQERNYLKGLAAYIHTVNRNVENTEAENMATYFVKYAEKYDVDEKIIMAIAQNESTFYNDVISSCGHKGMMQVSDGIARNAGYNPMSLYKSKVSIKVGARYFSIKIAEFGNTRLALTAYNQGSGSVHSGNYSSGYADIAMSRAEGIEDFLEENGYIE